MSYAGIGVFAICALLALISAVGTVVVKSAIRAAMCLLVHIIALSGLFLTLHAHLLAALQVVVYAGAIVVLFVFVIMLLGPGVQDPPTTRGLVSRTAAAAIMGMLTLGLSAALVNANPVRTLIDGCDPGTGAECHQFGGVDAFSRYLYIDGALPFELISVLLTVAIVGAIAVARGRTADEVEVLRRRKAEQAGSQAAASSGGQ
jgi:NADH-quinone oxidoreductase subunit J